MEPQTPFSIVIGANDPFLRRRLEEVVGHHPHFESLAAVSNAVQAADVARHCSAQAVLLVDESPGTLGRDVLPILEQEVPQARVIITSTGDLVELANRSNVSAAVPSGDLDAAWHALNSLSEWLTNPTDFGINRRQTNDRRMAQDWAKTFSQRRNSSRRELGTPVS